MSNFFLAKGEGGAENGRMPAHLFYGRVRGTGIVDIRYASLD